MADGALRSVFAELGIDFDEKSLEKANTLVDKAIGGIRKLVTATGAADQVEAAVAARQQARAATRHQQSMRAAADAEKASGGAAQTREVGFFTKLAELRAADDKARDESKKAEIDRAHTAAARSALGGGAPAFDPFGKRSEKGGTGFGGKFGAGQWKAAAKPVEGLIGLLTKLEQKTSSAIGQRLPRAFQRLAEKAGIARGDVGSMGQVLIGVTGGVTAALGGALAMASQFTAEFTQASEALRETARTARVTSSELQALQHAGTISGVGADRVTASVTALGGKLRDASSHLAGSGGVVHTLRRLGINARDASGHIRPTVDILDDVAVAMEHVSSPRRRIRIAESLGLDRRMLDVLHTGAGGIRALREEMQELGGGVTPEATEAARKFAQAQARMQVGLTSVRSVIFTSLAPSMETLVTKGAKLLGWLARMTRGSHMVRNTLVALGVAGAAAAAPLLVAWAPVVAPLLLAAAAGLVLALALDDVQNFLEGNHSLLGELVDDLSYVADGFLGVGTSAAVIQFIKDDWQALGDNVERVLRFLASLTGVAGAAFDALVPFGRLRHLFPGGSSAPPTRSAQDAEVAAATEAANARLRAMRAGRIGQHAEESGAPPRPGQRTVQAPSTRSVPAPGTRAVPIPSTRAVPAPGAAGAAAPSVVQHNQGDRNVFNVHGANTDEVMRRLRPLLEERDRRRNAERSPREATE